MKLESQTCRDIARWLQGLKGSLWLETGLLQSRHAQIQQGLDLLAGFFDQLAALTEGTESLLLEQMPWNTVTLPGLQTSLAAGTLLSSAMKGQTGQTSASMEYAAVLKTWNFQTEATELNLQVSALSAQAQVASQLQLFKKGKLDPRLQVQAIAGACMLQGQAMGVWQQGIVQGSAQVRGEVGAVYGKARAVADARGIDAHVEVGAAALRGSCVLAIQIADLKLELTMTGIVGGAEASASYRQTTRSWEAGTGAALGVGGSLKLGLSW